jgi:HEPN domain-containing protein
LTFKTVSTVIYHAQQAAEKYLKAFLASRGVLPKRTHNLQVLCEECSKLENTFMALEEDCRDLDYLSDDIRYPGIPNDSEEEMAHQAVSAYERICRTVIQKLEPTQI